MSPLAAIGLTIGMYAAAFVVGYVWAWVREYIRR